MDTLSELATEKIQDLPKILDLLDQGVAIFDPTLHLAGCNTAFVKLLGLPRRLGVPGTSLTDILRFQARRGDFGAGRAETLVRRRYQALAKLRRSTTRHLCRDGVRIALQYRRWRDGGLVVLCTDVSGDRPVNTEPDDAKTIFRDLIEHSLQGVMVHRDGTIVYVNRAFADLHGYRIQEMLGMDTARIVDPDDMALIERVRKKPQVDPFEMKGVRKDGSRLWLQVIGRDIEWDGAPARQVTVIDISKRKETEGEISRQAEILGQLQEAVIGVDLDGKIISWNDGARRLWGYSADEAIGAEVYMLHGHFQPFASVDDALRGLSIQPSIEVEQQFVRMNGEEFIGAARLSLLRDETGAPRSIIGLVTDITKRRRTEAALSESEALLRATLDAAINALITIDEAGLIQSMNATAERIFGYRARDIAGQNVTLLMPEGEGRRHAGYMRNYRQTGEAKIIGVGGRELVGRRSDGSLFPMELGITEMLHGGRRLFIGMALDITRRKETERVLRQHAAALDHLAEGVLVTDIDTRIVDCNPALERLFGYAKEEMMGMRPADLMADSGRWYRERKRRRKTIRETGTWNDEIAMRRKDGSEFICARCLAAFYDDAGQFSGIVGILRDITELRRTRELLGRQAAVLEQISDAVFVVSLDRRIIDCNAAASTMYGYSKPEMLTMRPWQFIADPESWEADAVGALREVDEKGGWRGEVDQRRQNGAAFAGELTLVPLVDERAERTGTIAVIRDITESRRTRELLGRQAAVLEQISDAVFITSLDREVIDCNAAASTVFGYSKPEMLTMRPWQFAADPESWQADAAGILRQVDEKDGWRGELDLRRQDGAVFAGELTLVPLVDEHGARTGNIAVIRDISERKATEIMLRQAQKMEAVGQLTGGMAHDFNNILTIVQGNLELLAEAVADDERLSDHAQRAQAATTRGAMLVQRLLAFSRKQVLQPEQTEINSLVLGMIDMLADTLHKKITVQADLEAELWPVIVDPSQLENAILNLAINARDAMPDGGTLTFHTKAFRTDGDFLAQNPSVKSGDYVRLVVIDTGVGMSREVMEQAFEPFFTTKNIGEGTGLGLSMVYGFVRQSSGFVRIDSTPGSGTRVELYFPRGQSG